VIGWSTLHSKEERRAGVVDPGEVLLEERLASCAKIAWMREALMSWVLVVRRGAAAKDGVEQSIRECWGGGS
jgi:hypothetical protein